MPIYTGDKLGFGVAPASGSGGGGSYEVGYSTSFDNVSHTKRTEHIWVVPKTARYNFEVWGADGGMGIAVNGDNQNGGIPRYGRGGKVECSMQLTAGTEIGLCIGDNGLPCFAYTSSNAGTFLNDGGGGWGGYQTSSGRLSFADGGNSNYNTRDYGGANSGQSGYSYQREYRGAGGGGGTIVRVVNSNENISSATDAQILIVVGGGGGAGARGHDHGNSNNQGGSGGNANDKYQETQWGRRGYFSGDTSYGWPSGNANHASSGTASGGGNGGIGYYAGGGGGGGGEGGGGGAATCSYCGTSAGSGGSAGNEGGKGNNGYNQSDGGGASTYPNTVLTVVGPGGSSNPNDYGGGGGGGGGYRGGGAGYWGNGKGHAGSGGGGGGSSWVTSVSAYDAKGLNGIATSPRYTSEQKPLRVGNPGGGRVFIWEANKDPLGKNRPAAMTAQKIQYACRSTNGSNPATPLYFLGSANNNSTDDGGSANYAAFNNYPYDISGNKCDAIVMNVAGSGKWELHSVTVGQAQGYDYPLPYRHKAWVHVIEGTETGGVGIHTEKFDLNNTTGNPAVGGWYGHMRAGAKNQNTNDGYQELFFEKPVVMNQGENYTIAVDWGCGGTVSSNGGGVACMNNGSRSTQTLAGTNTGSVTWSDVTAYNGPHGLGTKNQSNSMETDTTQGQLIHFGIKSYDPPSGGGGGGAYSTTDLIVDLDASKSSSYGGSGNTWYNIINGSGIDFTIDGASYNGSEGSGSFYFDGSNDIVYSNSNYDLSSYNYIFVDIAFKADNSTQIHLPFEHSQSWNSYSGAFGFAVHTDGNNPNLNEHHSNHNGGSSANWNYTVGTGWAVYGCQFAKTGSDTRKQYMNGQIVDFTNGNQYASPGSSFGNYVMYIGSRYGGVAPAKGYIGYVRVYASSSPLSASTISSNYDAIKSRYGLS